MKHKNPVVDKIVCLKLRETKRKTQKILLWLKDMRLVDTTVVGVLINPELISWLGKYYETKGYVPHEVKQIIHERLIKSGISSFLQISQYTPPDHVISPPALAYLLSQSEEYLLKFKTKAIKFDHGDTLETFKKQADDLITNVIIQLITPVNPRLFQECGCSCC